ncbi:hypothetical protein SK128_023453, partial [Halocaridina rubra]
EDGCSFYKITNSSSKWCSVDISHEHGFTFYVKPGNGFKKLGIRLTKYNYITFARPQFPESEKWYKINITRSVESKQLEYALSIDDKHIFTLSTNAINATEYKIFLLGSSFYSKTCSLGNLPPSSIPSEFLILGVPWWIIAACGGAILLLLVLIIIIIILIIRCKRTYNLENSAGINAWSNYNSTSGNPDRQHGSFLTPENHRQNNHQATDLQNQNLEMIPSTAPPMQVQGFDNPINTCNDESHIYENISKFGNPVQDGEEEIYQNIFEMRHYPSYQ